jgi:predicted N-acetyltransferase YhbS
MQSPRLRKTEPLHQRLDDRLVLRNPRDERDIERCAAFVSVNVREISGITTERVLHHFPRLSLNDYFFVEDEKTGEVVSNLCLIPWQCRFGDVMLDVAMLEIVATHPDYRKRGLIRTQINAFHDAVSAQNFDLSIIEGIPYYYRQFGYAYATDHVTSEALLSSHIPDLPAHVAPVRLRPATEVDVPQLAQFYDVTMSALDLTTLRSTDIWHYMLAAAENPLYIIEETQSNQIIGYVCVWRQPNGDLRIVESGMPAADTALALLHLCKQVTHGEIHIRWPQEGILVQVCRGLGSTSVPSDQWLLRINNVQSLLTKLAPLFEKRVAQSAHVGLTGGLTINLFRQAYQMRFAAGRLLEVSELGFVDASMGADGGDLCIAPDAFVRLLLGYRTLLELLDAWPDIVIRATSRHLLDTLFPKCGSFFSMPYFYLGKMERAFL